VQSGFSTRGMTVRPDGLRGLPAEAWGRRWAASRTLQSGAGVMDSGSARTRQVYAGCANTLRERPGMTARVGAALRAFAHATKRRRAMDSGFAGTQRVARSPDGAERHPGGASPHVATLHAGYDGLRTARRSPRARAGRSIRARSARTRSCVRGRAASRKGGHGGSPSGMRGSSPRVTRDGLLEQTARATAGPRGSRRRASPGSSARDAVRRAEGAKIAARHENIARTIILAMPTPLLAIHPHKDYVTEIELSAETTWPAARERA
jgi:hypothetical protein